MFEVIWLFWSPQCRIGYAAISSYDSKQEDKAQERREPSAQSRSVMFMKNALARLQATEQQKPVWSHTAINKFIDRDILPFVEFRSLKARI
jgi:hypothetical protein